MQKRKSGVKEFDDRLFVFLTSIPYFKYMIEPLDLLEETIDHLNEGARSVRAFGTHEAYIITKAADSDEFVVTIDAPPYQKTRTRLLDPYFGDVFGIQATY